MKQNYTLLAKKWASKRRWHTVQSWFFSIYLYVCYVFGFTFTLCSYQPFFSPQIECWKRARRRIRAFTHTDALMSENNTLKLYLLAEIERSTDRYTDEQSVRCSNIVCSGCWHPHCPLPRSTAATGRQTKHDTFCHQLWMLHMVPLNQVQQFTSSTPEANWKTLFDSSHVRVHPFNSGSYTIGAFVNRLWEW